MYFQIHVVIKNKARISQIISKCLLGVFNFFQKTQTKTRRKLVKTNSFVRFLEEFTAWQFAFKINWPLVIMWKFSVIFKKGLGQCFAFIWMRNHLCNIHMCSDKSRVKVPKLKSKHCRIYKILYLDNWCMFGHRNKYAFQLGHCKLCITFLNPVHTVGFQ